MVFLVSVHPREQPGTLEVQCGYQNFDGLLPWDFEIFLDLKILLQWISRATTLSMYKGIMKNNKRLKSYSWNYLDCSVENFP